MLKLKPSPLLLAVAFCLVAFLPSCGDDDGGKAPQVTAGFTFKKDAETKGKVAFTNTSKNAKTYVWDFGEGSKSDAENPVHTYTKDGTYKVTLTATNGEQSAEAKETVSINISGLPVITLKGDARVSIKIGAEYKDAGATALDALDKDISSKIVVVGDAVNTLQPGEYVITYDATDAQGKKATQVTRTVTVTFDAGLLTNGDFQTGDENGWTLSDDGVAIKTEEGNSFLHANVATAGTDSRDIYAAQKQIKGVAHGNIYTLSFNASSDAARTIGVGFQDDAPFDIKDLDRTISKTFDLSSETQRFAYEMTISSQFFFDNSDPVGAIFFMLGGKAGSVDIDNVSFEFVEKAKFVRQLPADFEDGATFGFSGQSIVVLSNVANPDPSGINTSANVLKVTRLSGSLIASFYNDFPTPFKPEDGSVFKLKVWSHVKDARLDFILNGPNVPTTILSKNISTAQTWQELTFDFSKATNGEGKPFNLADGGYNRIFINPNANGDPATIETFYFDDIRQVK